MSDIGAQVRITQGRVSRHAGITFNAFYAGTASGRRPPILRLGVQAAESGQANIDVYLGERFQIAGQTWELTALHNPSAPKWHATLTRIA